MKVDCKAQLECHRVLFYLKGACKKCIEFQNGVIESEAILMKWSFCRLTPYQQIRGQFL